MATGLMIASLLYMGLLIAFGATGLILYRNYKNKQHRLNQIIHFTDYYGVLEYHLSRAYEMIYKDRVLIYSLEAMKLDNVRFIAATKAFGNLVLRMIGPTLAEEFADLYGNEETFLFVLSEYFNKKYEEDEIRKDSIDEVMNQEVESS